MKTEKFGFIADTHLRLTQYGSERRGQDFLSAVLNAIDVCYLAGITTIFHGGDLLDASEIDGRVFSKLRIVDAHLKGLGMRMFAITGNHDMSNEPWHSQLGNTLTELPDGTYEAKTFGIFDIDHTIVTVQGLRIWGLPFMNPSQLRATLAGFGTKFPNIPMVDFVMWHGMVKEFLPVAGDDAISCHDFAQWPCFTNVLLGDIHIRKFFALRHATGGPGIIGYPGSTEVTKSNEDVAKSVTVLTVQKYDDAFGGFKRPITPEVTSLPIKTRAYWPIRVTSEDAMQTLLNSLQTFDRKDHGPVICATVSADIESFAKRVHNAAPPGTLLLDPRVIDTSSSIAAAFDMSTIRGEDPVLEKVDVDVIIRKVLPGIIDDLDFNAFCDIARNPETASAIFHSRVKEIIGRGIDK
jgi:DNA repair exonuclease SbcCD nuclease subunit